MNILDYDSKVWYKSDFFGVFRILDLQYRPNIDVYELFYETYSGVRKFVIITSEFVKDVNDHIFGPATLDDIMLEEL